MVVQFDQQDAIEFFCRIVAKIENLNVQEFKDVNLILSRLIKYTKAENYLKVAIKIFGTKTNDAGEVVPKRPRLFYEFVTSIRYEQLYPWDEKDFKDIITTLELGRIDYQVLEEPKKFSPSRKMNNFVATSWWLFFCEEAIREETKKEAHRINFGLFKGVSRAVVQFELFGKVSVKYLDTKSQNVIRLHGTYEIKKDNDKYLLITLNSIWAKTVPIRMLFYIGIEDSHFVMGNFDSFDEHLNSKKGILEKVIDVPIRKLNPIFYCKHLQENNDHYVSEAMWYYFTKLPDIATLITNRADFESRFTPVINSRDRMKTSYKPEYTFYPFPHRADFNFFKYSTVSLYKSISTSA